MPARRDFRAEDLQSWMGYLALNDVLYAPLRLRVRLVGTRIVGFDGAGYAGQFLDELLPAAVRDSILRPYFDCVRRRAPVHTHYEDDASFRRRVSFAKLILPLSTDGEVVDMLLVGVYAEYRKVLNGRSQTLFDPIGSIAGPSPAPAGRSSARPALVAMAETPGAPGDPYGAPGPPGGLSREACEAPSWAM